MPAVSAVKILGVFGQENVKAGLSLTLEFIHKKKNTDALEGSIIPRV